MQEAATAAEAVQARAAAAAKAFRHMTAAAGSLRGPEQQSQLVLASQLAPCVQPAAVPLTSLVQVGLGEGTVHGTCPVDCCFCMHQVCRLSG